MPSSTLGTEPTANGHEVWLNEQPKGVIEALVDAVDAIKILSKDTTYQPLRKLLEEYKSLKTDNGKLTEELKEESIAMRNLIAKIAGLDTENLDANARLEKKNEELEASQRNAMDLTHALEEERETVKEVNGKLEITQQKYSEVLTSSQARKDEVMRLQQEVRDEKKALKRCQEKVEATQKKLTDLEKEHTTTTLKLRSLNELAFELESTPDLGDMSVSIPPFYAWY